MSDTAGDSDGPESRRKRIRQACLNCRRKKVRCGGEKPICTFCSRLSQTCIYAEDGRSNRRASSTNPASGLDDESNGSITNDLAMKVESMDERLARMESALQSATALLATMASNAQAQTPRGSCCATSSDQTHETLAMQQVAHFPPPAPAQAAPISLPPLHTLQFAADVYFRFCHNQPYSLFHETTFRQRLGSGEVPGHLVWALLAAARRFSSLPDVHPNLSDDPLAYARLSWENLKLPWNGVKDDQEAVSIIQTIVLLVNIEHPAGHCTAAYMKLGFALRIALHSRLHAEPDGEVPAIFREERKRTFWSMYLQDKLISLARERTPVLRDEMCRIALPCSEPAFREGKFEDCPGLHQFIGDELDEAAVERCCPLALIAVMACALNRVSEYALHENRYSELGAPWSPSSPYTSISASLLQLEVHFGMSEPFDDALKRRNFVQGTTDAHVTSSFLYAKSLFHLSHCLLHHPFLLQQRLQRIKQKAPASFSKNARETCRLHAKNITGLKNSRSHTVLMLPSLYAYCHMVAGTIHALNLNDDDSAVREEAAEHFKLALDFLRDLSRYWSHATLMATRLQRFRQKAEGHNFLVDHLRDRIRGSELDERALWQSVDYSLLSTPTRPGSPRPESQTGPVQDLDFSPSYLFDFPLPEFGNIQNMNGEAFGGIMLTPGTMYDFPELGTVQGDMGTMNYSGPAT